MMDHREGLGSITVTGTRGSTALVDISHRVRLARGAKVS
jgi:hypothetical protein